MRNVELFLNTHRNAVCWFISGGFLGLGAVELFVARDLTHVLILGLASVLALTLARA